MTVKITYKYQLMNCEPAGLTMVYSTFRTSPQKLRGAKPESPQKQYFGELEDEIQILCLN